MKNAAILLAIIPQFIDLDKPSGVQVTAQKQLRHAKALASVQVLLFYKSENPMAFFDISTRALRSALNPRPKAYWHRIVPNHHVGIFVSKTNGASWVSRVRPENGRYIERTLGRATLLGQHSKGGGYFGFKAALKKAETFRKN